MDFSKIFDGLDIDKMCAESIRTARADYEQTHAARDARINELAAGGICEQLIALAMLNEDLEG